MKSIQLKTLVAALALAAGMSGALPAQASEREQLEALRETTQAILDALVAKGILSADDAKALVKQAEEKGQAKAEALAKEDAAAKDEAAPKDEPGVVRVPYIPEVVKREIKEELRQEVVAKAKAEGWGEANTVPDWLDRIKIDGDLRVRYEHDLFSQSNAPYYDFPGANLTNTTADDQAGKVRLRLGISAKVADGVTAGVRIASGNNNSPVSTNQTLGTGMAKNALWLDRAYVKLAPRDWLSASAGRIPNPFFSTDLVWDDDLNFDGGAISITPWANEPRDGKPFLTLGIFPLQHTNPTQYNVTPNRWLYGAQAGLDWKAGPDTRLRFGTAYYRYRNIAAIANNTGIAAYDNDYLATILPNMQKGNSLYQIDTAGKGFGLASQYDLVDLTASLDLAQYEPTHITLTGDVVKNVGYNNGQMQSRMGAGYEERTLGYQTKLAVGMPAMRLPGDWQVYGGYRYLERDAVLDAFTDSDFHLGGTNAKGWFIGGMYGLERNTWLNLRWMSSDVIDGPKLSIDVLQADLNVSF